VTIRGGCLCQALRYEIAADKPIAVRACWCRTCQYLGAGSGTVNAVFDKGAIAITGESVDYVSVADSGSVMHRKHCPRCGTPVFSEAEPRPNVIIVRVGTLDDPEIARPAMTIWTKSAPSWACFDPAIPSVEGQAPPAK
jgi:hypothetical protein